jgi:outer membrane protein assembly factor BamD
MVASYDKLGLAELRDDADRVLKKNFPKSPFVEGGVRPGRPWWKFW